MSCLLHFSKNHRLFSYIHAKTDHDEFERDEEVLPNEGREENNAIEADARSP